MAIGTATVSETGSPAGEGKSNVRNADHRHFSEVFQQFAAAPGERRMVQLMRPFSIISKNTYSAPITMPISLVFLAGPLEHAGYRVNLIDAMGEDVFNIVRSTCGRYNLQGLSAEKLIERIDPETRILGITMMFTQEWPEHRNLIRTIRKLRPDLTIIVGGEHPSALPEYVLRDCPEIDYLIAGEADLVFLEFVHKIMYGHDVRGIGGLARIDENGVYVSNGLSQRIIDISDLPPPHWHLCRVENYFIGSMTAGVNRGRNMAIIASRGCPYQCTFCSNAGMWTTRYTLRDVNAVIDEIEHLIATYKANSFDFVDPTAIVKKGWILSFCQELKRRNLDITWQLPAGTRSELLDRETMQAMYDSGLRLMVFAPESGSERTLIAIKKKIQLSRLTGCIRDAVSVGHTVKFNLIIGFPNETYSDIFKTLAYAVKVAMIGADDCNIATFTPYPGSEIYRDLRDAGKIPPPSDDYCSNLVVQFDFLSSASMCENVPSWQIMIFRIVGLSLFYTLAYTFHPRRIVRLVKNMLKPTFQPSNLFEQRVYDSVFRSRAARSRSTAG